MAPVAHEIEWEYTAMVTGTVYAATEDEARQKAAEQLEGGLVSMFADVEDVIPCDPAELEADPEEEEEEEEEEDV